MTDNIPHVFSHAGGWMPCACQYLRPQLNETVTGRQSGCATCLCGSDDAGSSGNSAQGTQPSSGMDDLQQRVAIQLNIDGAVRCCHCCGQYPQHLIERAARSPKPKSKHGSVASRRSRHCGPWEQRSNGDFVLKGHNWEPSSDGRYSVRFSLELRYNSTRAASIATQPEDGSIRRLITALTSAHVRPVLEVLVHRQI